MTFDVSDQMNNSRYNPKEGRFERLENGEWVPWPVLKMDKYGRDEATRTIILGQRRR
jgi:hypothetical protein